VHTTAFVSSLAAELDAKPSPETAAVRETIDRRDQPAARPALNATTQSAPRPAEMHAVVEPPALGDALTVPPRPRWRRSYTLGVAAGVVVIATLGVVALTNRTRRSEPRLDPRRVLVATFENRTGDVALDPIGAMAMDWINQGISAAGLADVVDPRGSLLASRTVSTSGKLGEATAARALGQETGAGLVISGAYYQDGDRLRFQAQLSDADRGTILRSFQPVTVPRSTPVDALDGLRAQAMSALAEAVEPRLASFTRAASHPPSLEAYREYMEGVDLFARRDERAAYPHFLRAAAIDTSFTAAVLLAAASIELFDARLTDSLVAVLTTRRESLAPVHRLWLDGLIALRHDDAVEWYRLSRELARLMPGSFFPYAHAIAAINVSRPREARDALMAIDPERGWMRGWFSYWVGRGMARHQLGEHEAELADAEAGRRQYPASIAPIDAEVRALATLGRRRELDASLDQVVTMTPAGGWDAGSVFAVGALEANVHGHEAWVPDIRRRALAWYAGLPATERDRDREASTFGLTWVLYSVQAWDELAARVDWLARDAPGDLRWVAYRGVIAARHGDRPAAVRADSILAASGSTERLTAIGAPGRSLAQSRYPRAQIAALLGDRDRAVALLRDALAHGLPFTIYLHTDPAMSSLHGYPPFDALMVPKG
jgi:TolB-like protein